MNNLLPSYEEWKWIKGYEGRYEVSNRGRIRSWVRCGGGNAKNKGTLRFCASPKIRALHPTKFGYLQTSVGNDAMGDHKMVRVHREVAIAFIPNPENKPEVNHIMGDKKLNKWYELEWATRLENIKHAFQNKLIIPAVGERQSNTKLKNEEVLFIFKSLLPVKQLSKMFNIGEDAIGSIKIGRTWGHLTGKSRNPKVEKLSNEYILQIFNFHGTAKEASVFFKRSYSLCNNIKSGTKYSEITGKVFERRNKTKVQPTDDLILKIYNCPFDRKEISVLYGVSEGFIYNIKQGKRFNSITNHMI